MIDVLNANADVIRDLSLNADVIRDLNVNANVIGQLTGEKIISELAFGSRLQLRAKFELARQSKNFVRQRHRVTRITTQKK